LLLATFVGLLLIPMLYVLVQSTRESLKSRLFGRAAGHVTARPPVERLDVRRTGRVS
jgi:hypothetical protein